MLAKLKLTNGKQVLITANAIIAVEDAEEGVLIYVNMGGSTKEYNVVGTIDSFNTMLVESIYGDVVKQFQELGKRKMENTKFDSEFLKKLGVDPNEEDPDSGEGSPTIQ